MCLALVCAAQERGTGGFSSACYGLFTCREAAERDARLEIPRGGGGGHVTLGAMSHAHSSVGRACGSREQGWLGRACGARSLPPPPPVFLAFSFAKKMAEAGAGFLEQLKSCLVWSWTSLWTLWFFLMLFLVYLLRVPLKLNDNLTTGKRRRLARCSCSNFSQGPLAAGERRGGRERGAASAGLEGCCEWTGACKGAMGLGPQNPGFC